MRTTLRPGSLWSCLTLAALAVLLASCGGGTQAGPPPTPDVGVARPIQRDVTVFSEHLGNTEAYESVEVRARVTGELEEINFEPSTMVRQGDPLFVIEPRNYIAERNAADAALKSAEADLARAESDLKRVEQAVRTDAVSQSDVDLARAQRDMARASVLSAEAALDSAELQLSYTRVEAPIAGQVGRNLVDRGNIVSGSERTLLTTVNRMQPMFVYFDAPEEVVLRTLRNLDLTTTIEPDKLERAGARAEIATLIDEGFPFNGPIDYVSNTVDSATGTIRLRAVLSNEEMKLFPGLFVRVRIPVEVVEDAVLIREDALGTDLGGRFVYLVGDDNIVERRYVTLGVVEPDGMVPILEGLDGSETYIAEGLLRARPGMPVAPEAVSDTPDNSARGVSTSPMAAESMDDEAAAPDEVQDETAAEPMGEDG